MVRILLVEAALKVCVDAPCPARLLGINRAEQCTGGNTWLPLPRSHALPSIPRTRGTSGCKAPCLSRHTPLPPPTHTCVTPTHNAPTRAHNAPYIPLICLIPMPPNHAHNSCVHNVPSKDPIAQTMPSTNTQHAQAQIYNTSTHNTPPPPAPPRSSTCSWAHNICTTSPLRACPTFLDTHILCLQSRTRHIY